MASARQHTTPSTDPASQATHERTNDRHAYLALIRSLARQAARADHDRLLAAQAA